MAKQREESAGVRHRLPADEDAPLRVVLVVAAVDQHVLEVEGAAELGVSSRSAYRWLRAAETRGVVTRVRGGGYRRREA